MYVRISLYHNATIFKPLLYHKMHLSNQKWGRYVQSKFTPNESVFLGGQVRDQAKAPFLDYYFIIMNQSQSMTYTLITNASIYQFIKQTNISMAIHQIGSGIQGGLSPARRCGSRGTPWTAWWGRRAARPGKRPPGSTGSGGAWGARGRWRRRRCTASGWRASRGSRRPRAARSRPGATARRSAWWARWGAGRRGGPRRSRCPGAPGGRGSGRRTRPGWWRPGRGRPRRGRGRACPRGGTGRGSAWSPSATAAPPPPSPGTPPWLPPPSPPRMGICALRVRCEVVVGIGIGSGIVGFGEASPLAEPRRAGTRGVRGLGAKWGKMAEKYRWWVGWFRLLWENRRMNQSWWRVLAFLAIGKTVENRNTTFSYKKFNLLFYPIA